MIKKYSDVTFVVCHLCSHQENQYEIFKHDIQSLKLPNCFFDLASVSNNTHEPYPFNNALNYIKLAIEIVGDDKLMWGSDMPTSLTKSSYDNFINYIMNSDIPLSSKQKIFYDNANELYFKQ